MEGKKPDRVKKYCPPGPRMSKKEFIHSVVSWDLYARWKVLTGYNLTYNEFLEVWDHIAELIREEVVTNTHGIRLPFFNGDMLTNYITSLKRHIDRQASDIAGKDVHHLDWHSNGRPAKVVWSINSARRQHKWLILFAFEPCRQLRNQVSKGIKGNPGTYRLARTMAYIGYMKYSREK